MEHSGSLHSNQSQKAIILIDDHEIVRLGVSMVINAESDLRVVAQGNDTTSGLRVLQEYKSDLAIIDIKMPGPDVFEMVRVALKEQPQMKIIFLTAYDSSEYVQKAFNCGASGFITKSDGMGTIVTAIRSVLNGEIPYLSQSLKTRVVVGQTIQMPKKNMLSPRELEVLCCVAEGKSAKQIATSLSISSKTVERHKSNIMAKLSLHSQVDLTRFAIREGIIAP